MNPAFLLLMLAPPPLERDVPVRMRDGVVLRADVYRPAAPGRYPTLVYRTPYDRKRAAEHYSTIGAALLRGYGVVAQDVRGRYGSDGDFVPYAHEGRDGFDTIEWAAAQPWSDGRVGTFGLSYPGAVQWLAALEGPPHLLAMVPAMTFSTPRNFIHSGGVFDMSWTAWIWNNIAPDVRVRRGLAGPRTGREANAAWATLREPVQSRLPVSDLPEFRAVAPYLFDWMRLPPGDPALAGLEIRGRYDRVTAAVLNLSGWHDEAYGPEGAATNHSGLVAARGAAAARSQLVLGPWVHGSVTMNDRAGQERSGERTFGPAAAIDYDALILRFMDRHLRGLANGVDREKPVRVFVMGENAWREEEAWPPPSARPLRLYLAPPAAGGRGRLERDPSAEEGSSSAFVSNPLAPVADPFATEPGAHDYRGLVSRPDLLVFETEPFTEDLRVVGFLPATLHVSTDGRDLDLWARLFDVAPDGTAFNLMSPGLDVVRASYRDGGPERKLLEAGRVYPLRFEGLMTGNRFGKGHRLRLIVCAAFYPHFSRNLQTGALETESAAARTAEVRIHHDRAHPSWLALSVVP